MKNGLARHLGKITNKFKLKISLEYCFLFCSRNRIILKLLIVDQGSNFSKIVRTEIFSFW